MVFPERGLSAREALLVLQDGSFFSGRHFGSEKTAVGELVFNTSMTGYQEALTDPSYAGQVLTFAYPLQGNYGINEKDSESRKIHVEAVVCRESSPFYSHYSSKETLSEWLHAQHVPGIDGVDTRSIVSKVRERGVMPCAVAVRDERIPVEEHVAGLLEKVNSFAYSNLDFVPLVSPKKAERFSVKGAKKKVAFVDCGAKASMLNELLKRKLDVTVFPYDASAKEILKEGVDGVVFSNGPGDPARMKGTVETARALLGKKPVFGICLGHQVLALALGGKTYKLKFGHRGSNHAVRNVETGKVFITSQNHGYAVKDLPSSVKPLFENCNDGTNEGLRHRELPVFSCQFHPEGSCGPKDSNYLFDEFVKLL